MNWVHCFSKCPSLSCAVSFETSQEGHLPSASISPLPSVFPSYLTGCFFSISSSHYFSCSWPLNGVIPKGSTYALSILTPKVISSNLIHLNTVCMLTIPKIFVSELFPKLQTCMFICVHSISTWKSTMNLIVTKLVSLLLPQTCFCHRIYHINNS